MFDVNAVREQFPALNQDVNQSPLVYLDSAATTQKPQCVIDVISRYYSAQNANVHRGSHSLTANATSQFEAARDTRCEVHWGKQLKRNYLDARRNRSTKSHRANLCSKLAPSG